MPPARLFWGLTPQAGLPDDLCVSAISCPCAAAHSTAMSKNPDFSRQQTICPCRRGFRSDPRAFGAGPGPGKREPESGRPIGSSCRWPHAGHNADRPHPNDRGRSIASHKTGRWKYLRNRDLCCCVPLLQTRSHLPTIPAFHRNSTPTVPGETPNRRWSRWKSCCFAAIRKLWTPTSRTTWMPLHTASRFIRFG